MEISKSYLFGGVSAAIVLAISGTLFFLDIIQPKLFYFIVVICMIIAGLPFFMGLILESKREESINMMFLEFSRDLVEGVKSGTPISKSIINLKTKDYASLNPYVAKLANQISIGIPVKDALETFAKDIKSSVVSRSVSLIREAEIAGGRIESILESVAYSVSQIEKLRKERKAAISTLTVQGYIIFLIFIVIMLVMEFKIIPILTNLGSIGLSGGSLTSGTALSTSTAPSIKPEDFAQPFLYLLLTQGFFAGLVIGKLSEGNIKGGLKHSFILVTLALLMSKGADLLFLK